MYSITGPFVPQVAAIYTEEKTYQARNYCTQMRQSIMKELPLGSFFRVFPISVGLS